MQISAKVAQELGYKEYDKFKIKIDKLYKLDFDNFLYEKNTFKLLKIKKKTKSLFTFLKYLFKK